MMRLDLAMLLAAVFVGCGSNSETGGLGSPGPNNPGPSDGFRPNEPNPARPIGPSPTPDDTQNDVRPKPGPLEPMVDADTGTKPVVEPGVIDVVALTPIAFRSGTDPLDYPPVTDISANGGVLWALDTDLCVRPSTEHGPAGECTGGNSSLGQVEGLFSFSRGPLSRLAVDSALTSYVALVPDLQYQDPTSDQRGAVAVVPAVPDEDVDEGVPIVLYTFDFTAGVGVDVLERNGLTEVYVLDQDATGYRIQVLDANLAVVDSVPVDPALSLTNPTTLAVGAEGEFFVISSSQPRLVRLTPEGTVDATFELGLTEAQAATFAPVDVAIDSQGRLFVLDAGNSKQPVEIFSSSGAAIPSEFTLDNPEFEFDSPRSIEVDADGNVYVLNTSGFSEAINPGEEPITGQGLVTLAPLP
jgi:hypothetical protein